MTEFTVPLLALRQALLAVRAHADKPGEDLGVVRLLPGARVLHVMATDRYSMALAKVPIESHADGELGQIDLTLDDVAKVLAVFKMPADKSMWPGASLRISRSGIEVTFADAGGLFDGQALTGTAYDVEKMPDVRPAIGSVMRSEILTPGERAQYALSAKAIVKLGVAAKTYAEPVWAALHRLRTSSTWVAICGSDFIAATTAVLGRVASDTESRETPAEQWRRTWRDDLAGVPISSGANLLRHGSGVHLTAESLQQAAENLDTALRDAGGIEVTYRPAGGEETVIWTGAEEES